MKKSKMEKFHFFLFFSFYGKITLCKFSSCKNNFVRITTCKNSICKNTSTPFFGAQLMRTITRLYSYLYLLENKSAFSLSENWIKDVLHEIIKKIPRRLLHIVSRRDETRQNARDKKL